MVIDSVKVKRLNGSRRPRPTTRSRDFLRLNKSWMNSINQKAAPWKESCKLLRICKRSLPPAFQRRAKVTPLKLEAKCKMSLMFYHLAREAKWLQKIGQNLDQKMISKCMWALWAVDDSLRSSKSEEAEGPNWVQLRRLRSQPAHELHLSESRWPID